MRRRTALALGAAATTLGSAAAADAPRKVFRMAIQIAETGFDPARISDIYSRSVTGHIFEALFNYDPLARPARIRPCIATALPECNADFTEQLVRLRPGDAAGAYRSYLSRQAPHSPQQTGPSRSARHRPRRPPGPPWSRQSRCPPWPRANASSPAGRAWPASPW